MTTPRSNWLSQAITADALKRFPQSIAGQAVFATGLVMMLAAGVGLPSWEILHQGLSKQLGIEIGTAAQLSGIFVLLLWIPLRQRPGLGTLSNIVVIGWVMNVELALLAYLAERPGRVCTREELLEAVWGPDYLGTPRTVDQHVLQLREKLGEDPKAPRFLETVRGVGYRFREEA